MAIAFHKFIERLNRSKLLTTQQLQSLLAACPKDRRPGDTESLARWLVKDGHLTPFQAKAIYLGHTKGLIVGNYEVLDLLGVGGMGQVYKARHRRMKRIVALKLLSPEVAQNPKLVSRFHQEVEAAAQLMHPNIVTAFDADEAGGKHFLVMEYVPGRDLASLIKERGPLSVDRSMRCILDAARGLEYAHNRGIVHRDIKPSNLLMVANESHSALEDARTTRVKILDMGLARIDDLADNAKSSDGLTKPGIVMGTVDFMSPEQAVNTHEAGPHSDMYSLGITLYYLLTGEVPFTGRTVIEQVLAHREAEIPSLQKKRREVSAGLDAIFAKMVAKKVQDRYASMGDVVAALDGVLSNDESDSDLPIILPDDDDDSALNFFLDSMSGDPRVRQRAAAAVITPTSNGGGRSDVDISADTLVTTGGSTDIGPTSRIKRRRAKPVPWGAILFHVTWSFALLGGAVWMLVDSRKPEPVDAPDRAVAGMIGNSPIIDDMLNGDADGGAAANVDVERQFAEWILGKGGTIKVAAAARSEILEPGGTLPSWSFSIATIDLPSGAIGDGDDLDRLSDVSRLKLLQRLNLGDNPELTDHWFAALDPFNKLMQLDLSETSVTDATLIRLVDVAPTLESLDISGCEITAAGIEALFGIPRLRELNVSQTPLDDAAVPHLQRMTTLEQLDIRGTALTSQHVQTLRESLPNCRILALGAGS